MYTRTCQQSRTARCHAVTVAYRRLPVNSLRVISSFPDLTKLGRMGWDEVPLGPSTVWGLVLLLPLGWWPDKGDRHWARGKMRKREKRDMVSSQEAASRQLRPAPSGARSQAVGRDDGNTRAVSSGIWRRPGEAGGTSYVPNCHWVVMRAGRACVKVVAQAARALAPDPSVSGR